MEEKKKETLNGEEEQQAKINYGYETKEDLVVVGWMKR